MTSGRQTLAEIEGSIDDLKQREHALRDELESATARRSELIEQRLKAYRELAEVRTRHAVSDGVIDEADRLSVRVADLLAARQKTIASLKERREAGEKRRSDLVRQGEALADRIEKLEAKLDRFAMEAREALTAEPAYRTEVKAQEEARQVYQSARKKAEQSRADRIEKGRAYEGDLLFMYLWRRKYGSATYDAMDVIKWLDGKVAGLVGYHAARANYAVLCEIPDRLDAHVKALRNGVAQKQAALEAREAEKIQELARTDLAASLREVRDDEAANKKAIAEVSAELTDVGEQVNQYAGGRDPAFRKAIELSAEFLGQEATASLMVVARQTLTPTDDQIVERIRNLDRQVSEQTREIARKNEALDELSTRRDELLRISADYRRAGYDDPGSVLRSERVAGVLLEALVRGAITGLEYWARTRRRQSWKSRPADPWRRSEGFPPFGDSIFGGGGWGDRDDDSWGGGSWDDDDDFRTSGKF